MIIIYNEKGKFYKNVDTEERLLNLHFLFEVYSIFCVYNLYWIKFVD